MALIIRLEPTLGSLSGLHYRSLQFRHPTLHLAQRLGRQIVSALIKVSPFFREQKEDIISFLLIGERRLQAVRELAELDDAARRAPGAGVVVELALLEDEIFRLPGRVLQQPPLGQSPQVASSGAGWEGGDTREDLRERNNNIITAKSSLTYILFFPPLVGRPHTGHG